MKHTADHAGPDVLRELHEQWSGTAERSSGPEGRPGPELVGHAVADTLGGPIHTVAGRGRKGRGHGPRPAAGTE